MGTLLSPQSIPVPDGDKGDITVSGGGTAFTIDPATVTTAKLVDANVSSAKLGVDVTAAGKAILTGSSAAAQRTSLGLAAIAASGSGADLAAASVPFAAIANVAAVSFLGNSGGSSAAPAAISEATARSMIGGCFLGTRTLSGTNSDTLPAGTALVHVQGVGGGGGGAGGAANSAGSGGNSGTMIDLWFGAPGGTPLASSYSWVGGAGGTGGSNTGGAGTQGGDSTLTIGGQTLTAKGGAPGGGTFPNAQPSGSTSSGTGILGTGLVSFGVGTEPVIVAGVLLAMGDGGGTFMGAGGAASTATAGTTAPGAPSFGGGGSGGRAGDVGGGGAAGGFRVEFYS